MINTNNSIGATLLPREDKTCKKSRGYNTRSFYILYNNIYHVNYI